MTRLLQKAMAVPAALVMMTALSAAPASAHTTIDTVEPLGNGASRISFSFDHACGTSPTTAVAITLPAGSVFASADPPDGWNSKLKGRTVLMSGPDLPSDRQVTYSVTARLTGQVGQALLFPTVQTCANGEVLNWTDTDEAGEEPAPRLIATAAVLSRAVSVDTRTETGASSTDIAISIALFAALGAALHHRRFASIRGRLRRHR